MKIACIAWGSLIWDKKNLDVGNEWYSDGPSLPLEFARQSKNGRVTLVICPGSKMLQTLWTLFNTNDLKTAVNSLRVREETIPKHIRHIFKTDKPINEVEASVCNWLNKKNIDSAIWTGLPPKWNGVDHIKPSLDELIKYLQNLEVSKYDLAKEYVERTPLQIETEYRASILKTMNWSSQTQS